MEVERHIISLVKLMLTSFGAGSASDEGVTPGPWINFRHWYPHVRGHLERPENPFYGMPPVSMKAILGPFFVPDYSTLLFADHIVLDTASFSALQWQHHRSYALVAEAMQILKAEGFVELADYRTVLNDNRRLLDQMLESDMEDTERWKAPLEESAAIWTQFMHRARDLVSDSPELRDEDAQEAAMPQLMYLHEASAHLSGVHSYLHYEAYAHHRGLPMGDRVSDLLRRILVPYLAYVNANIVLSNELGVGFHDWMDYSPFYQKKFVSVGKLDVEHQETSAEAVHTLFKLSFPDLAIHDVKQFVKLVKDRRIESLRAKIQEAVDGKIRFDGDFARQTLHEVLRLERRAAHYRHVTFFLTLPLHFIPLVGAAVHKVAEEAVNTVVERKLKRPFRWFYLLSDVSEKIDSHKVDSHLE